MGWGGVGWGAITFLALHPRLDQHGGGGGGGVGWGAITFLLQAAGRFLGAIISQKKQPKIYQSPHGMVRIP